MDKNMLEFWGQAMLNAARSQQQMEDMNKMFGQNFGVENPFMNSMFKVFGLQNSKKMENEEIVELTQKSSEAYKEFFKAYLTMFDVVSREEYINLEKENEDLKAKIVQQEKIINGYKNLSGKDNFDQEQIVDNLAQIMKNQTQQFQELMKQVNQYYKKDTPSKKK